MRKLLFRRSFLVTVAVALFLFLANSAAFSQIVQTSSDQVAPTAGTGHNYEGFANSAVDPATGGVNAHLGTPVPGALGPHVSFSFSYHSGSAHHLQPGIGWTDNSQYLGAGGWLYDFPVLLMAQGYRLPDGSGGMFPAPGVQAISADCNRPVIYISPDGSRQVGQGTICGDTNAVPAYAAWLQSLVGGPQPCISYGNFLFEHPSQGTHTLPVMAGDPSCGFGPVPAINAGSDEHFAASVVPMTGGQRAAPPLTVSDVNGTIYSFSQKNNHVGGPQTGSQVTVLPDFIEDRNGNKTVITDSGNGVLKVTDSAGRTVIQTDGFSGGKYQTLAPSGVVVAVPGQDHITISGLANPYTVQWTPEVFSWNPSAQILVTAQPPGTTGSADVTNRFPNRCGRFASDTSTTLGPVTGSQSEITSITLPNGLSYQFGYDYQYDLLNQITYPNGATVHYFWGMDAENGFPNYTLFGSQTSGQACEFLYAAPMVEKEIISFDGQTPALERDYTYSTTWHDAPYGTNNTTTSGGRFQQWTSKTTTVVTHDLLAGTTFTTKYTYAPIGTPLPPGPTPVTGQSGVSLTDPVEQSVEIVDANNVALRLITKTYVREQLPPVDVKTTLENGQTQEVFDCYFGVDYQNTVPSGFKPPAPCRTGGPGSLISDRFEYDFGGASITPQPGDTLTVGTPGVLLRHSLVDYQSAIANPIVPQQIGVVDLPADQIVEDGNGSPMAETQYAYDQSPLSTASASWHDDQNFPSTFVSRGNLTSKTVLCYQGVIGNSPECPQGSSLTTTYTYDQTGQVVSITDPIGNANSSLKAAHTAQYIYSDRFADTFPPSNFQIPSGNTNAYLTQIVRPTTTNAEGQQVQHILKFSYAPSDGQLTIAIDENGQSTQYFYNDILRRETGLTAPDGSRTTISFNDQGSNPSVTTTRMNSAGVVSSTAIADGIGHAIQVQHADPEGTIYSDTTYTGLGQKFTQSNPYREQGESTYGLSRYRYDALGRAISVTNPDGTIAATNYSVTASEVADEGNGSVNVQHIAQNDGLGRLLSVCEITGSFAMPMPGNTLGPVQCNQTIGGFGFLTTYQYDIMGNLLTVHQDNFMQDRKFTYNSLGQLLTASNPEAGTLSYNYDQNGNVISRTAPAPNQTGNAQITTAYQYDNQNRLIGKTYWDGSSASGTTPVDPLTPPVTFNYDETQTQSGQAIAYPIGHKTSESTAATSFAGATQEIFSYDSMGHINQDWQCTPATCGSKFWNLSYNYKYGDLMSAVNGVNSTTFTYQYDTADRLTQMNSSWSDATHPANLFSAIGYGPFGLTNASYGNEAWGESRLYDQRGRLLAQTDTAMHATTAGSATITIAGSERATQIVTKPATPGTGSLTIIASSGSSMTKTVAAIPTNPQCGALQSSPCASPDSSGSANPSGATVITIAGTERQSPPGQTPGIISVTISGSEQNPVVTVAAAAGTGTVTVGGVLQSRIVTTNAATQSKGSVTIGNSEQSANSFATGYFAVNGAPNCGGMYGCAGGGVGVSVNGFSAGASFGSASDTISSVASQLASGLNASGSPVTATVSGNGVSVKSKVAGSAGNYSMSTSCHPGAMWSFCAFNASASGSTMTGGGLVYDTGQVSVSMNFGSGSQVVASCPYGQNDNSSTIAACLAPYFNPNSSQKVTAGASPNSSVVTVTSTGTGSGVNYPMTVSVITNNPSGLFPTPSFTASASGMASGNNAVLNTIYDQGTATVSVNGTGYPYNYGAGDTVSTIATGLQKAINAFSSVQVTGITTNTSANPPTATLNLKATKAAASTNYTLSSSLTYDTAHFTSSSFTPTTSGAALTGGRDEVDLYDQGTVALSVYPLTTGFTCASPNATALQTYQATWGKGATASSLASALATTIQSLPGGPVHVPVAPTGATLNLTTQTTTNPPGGLGAIFNYPICVSVSDTTTTNFSSASFGAAASSPTLTGGWPNANAVDGGVMTVTINGQNYQTSWGVNDTDNTIAGNLVAAIANSSGWPNSGLIAVKGGNSVIIAPKSIPTAYTVSTSTTFNNAVNATEGAPDFWFPSFTTSNAIADWGTVKVTANGHTDSYSWSGASDGPGNMAVSLANAVNQDAAASVTAIGNSGTATVSVTASQPGPNSNYAWSAVVTNDAADFPTLPYSVSLSSAALTGGAAPVQSTVGDTGVVGVAMNGDYDQFLYGANDTPSTIAANLAAAIQGDPAAPVTASASGNVVTLTAKISGDESDYAFTVNAGSNSANFNGGSSFTAAASGSTLQGGVLNGSALYDYSLAYAPDGVILGSHDAVNGNWAYNYDPLNRLISASSTNESLAWSYDRYGNRWSQTLTQGSNQSASSVTFNSGNNRMDSASGYQYDAAGNVVYVPASALGSLPEYLTYDAEGRLVCVANAQGACAEQYIYNAVGERVAKAVGPSIVSEYVIGGGGEHIAELDGNHNFIRGEIGQYGTYWNGSTYFAHTDWLGTMRMRSDPGDNVSEQCSSLPFGDNLSCTGTDSDSRHLTGKERDWESGLDYFGARYYGSNLGRFMIPDWSAKTEPVPFAKIGDPQSFNLYAYVGNNPITGIDADGHEGLLGAASGAAAAAQAAGAGADELVMTTVPAWVAAGGGAAGGATLASVSVAETTTVGFCPVCLLPFAGGFYIHSISDRNFSEATLQMAEATVHNQNRRRLQTARPAQQENETDDAYGQRLRQWESTGNGSYGEILASGPTSHLNGSIAEYHGYLFAIEKLGHIGVQAPDKATAPGIDFATYDPIRRELVVWDAKYRGPNGGSYPTSVPADKLKSWLPELGRAIGSFPAGPLKNAMLDAFNSGRVRGQIFRWPK